MATWYICYYHLIAYRIYFISMYIVQIGNNWFRITITVLIDTFYVCFQFGPTIHWYLLLIIATFSCVLRQILLRKTKSRFITMKEVKNECIYECMSEYRENFHLSHTKSFIHSFNYENMSWTYIFEHHANWKHKRTNHILSNIELEPSNEKFIRRHWIISTIQICVFQSLIFTFHARTHICWNSPFLMHCRNKIPEIYASHFSI